MSKWATRAAAHFLQTQPEPTPITPETRVMGVMGVPPPRIYENESTSIDALMAAALKACDFHNDSVLAREAMRLQVMETASEHHADLLEHFHTVYGARHA
jgi:hypothetical protein